jgi:hypothetical protein
MKLFIIQFYPSFSYILLMSPLFSDHTGPLKHPHSVFFPVMWETKYHTQTKTCIFLIFKFSVADREKSLTCMVTSIPDFNVLYLYFKAL